MNFGSLAGQLAGKVRKNIENANVSSTTDLIARIGEVVAPPLESDEEYETDSEYETESGSEYDDEGSFVGEEDEEEFEFDTQSSHAEDIAPFNYTDDGTSNGKDAKSNMKKEDAKISSPYEGDNAKIDIPDDSEIFTTTPSLKSSVEIALAAESIDHDYAQSGTTPKKNFRETDNKTGDESTNDHSITTTEHRHYLDDATNYGRNDQKQRLEPVPVVMNKKNDKERKKTKNVNNTYQNNNKESTEFVAEKQQQADGSSSAREILLQPGKNETITATSVDDEATNNATAVIKPVKKSFKDAKDVTKPLRPAENDDAVSSALDTPSSVDEDMVVVQQQSEYESAQHRVRELEDQLERQKNLASKTESRFRKLLSEASKRTEALERQLSETASRYESESSAQEHRRQHALKQSDQRAKMAHQKLEESALRIQHLEQSVEEAMSMVRKTKEQAARAEKEAKRTRKEKDSLKTKIEELNEEIETKDETIELLEEEKQEMGGVQMELHLMKEARDRDQQQIQSTVESASSNLSKLSAERDEARSKVQSLTQRLAATNADLKLSQNDLDRAMLSNGNLQNALEAFQNERDAEVKLLEDQRREAEAVVMAVHEAKLATLREENENKIRDVQFSADMTVKNIMAKMESQERGVEQLRKDNVSLRRSLDEAIQRLQMSQEDVIDRLLMKNILLDWHSKRGQDRQQVLELMASVLHFSEDEKSRIHLGESAGGTLGKVVNAVTAPLPKSNLDVDKLEGDSVREKWVNFLLAETGDFGDEPTK